ncbi:7-deoxyloganetin glucosyltransferase-like [Rhododendron vialii]|uniref:7-deoxyloganetin glucosyltransferase-like n=1 Tax=Rhododendron vialii TaxID=182163 RepID=UPI00265F502F|nr:7-deoxyloganetin glucosyltransferase-like [Rhododendron vialii]
MTPQQLCEFAWGICNRNQPFLWIITPDFTKGQLATLPLEFLKKTKERGLIATWSPQEQALAHPSIGVFVSHFGTSSMLASICAGVPMIGWPYFGPDHQETCRYSCNRWGIGMKINEDMEREEVESLVRELMEGMWVKR